jgi:hypothetical protein
VVSARATAAVALVVRTADHAVEIADQLTRPNTTSCAGIRRSLGRPRRARSINAGIWTAMYVVRIAYSGFAWPSCDVRIHSERTGPWMSAVSATTT